MKGIYFKFSSVLVIFFSMFLNQVVAGDIIIRRDDDMGSIPNRVARMSTFTSSSTTFITISANLTETDLIVDFSTPVGTAVVSVVDESGNVVYQTTVDTFIDSEVIIPVDGLNSGNYSLKISYDSTNLIGDFQF